MSSSITRGLSDFVRGTMRPSRPTPPGFVSGISSWRIDDQADARSRCPASGRRVPRRVGSRSWTGTATATGTGCPQPSRKLASCGPVHTCISGGLAALAEGGVAWSAGLSESRGARTASLRAAWKTVWMSRTVRGLRPGHWLPRTAPSQEVGVEPVEGRPVGGGQLDVADLRDDVIADVALVGLPRALGQPALTTGNQSSVRSWPRVWRAGATRCLCDSPRSSSSADCASGLVRNPRRFA